MIFVDLGDTLNMMNYLDLLRILVKISVDGGYNGLAEVWQNERC